MKDQYERISKLNESKNVTIALGLCKLIEEIGELAQSCNMTLGIKNRENISDVAIKENVLEECADSIQNIMSIANLYGITYEQLQIALKVKTDKWEQVKTESI